MDLVVDALSFLGAFALVSFGLLVLSDFARDMTRERLESVSHALQVITLTLALAMLAVAMLAVVSFPAPAFG